jgi:hypothetical protein
MFLISWSVGSALLIRRDLVTNAFALTLETAWLQIQILELLAEHQQTSINTYQHPGL